MKQISTLSMITLLSMCTCHVYAMDWSLKNSSNSEAISEDTDVQKITNTFPFPTTSTPRLTLTNQRGTVRIYGWDKPTLQITTIKKALRNLYLPKLKSFVDVNGNHTHIIGTIDDVYYNKSRRTAGTIDYSIYIPHSTITEVNAKNCDILVDNLSNQINVQNVNGSIAIRQSDNANAMIQVTSNTGNINIQNASDLVRTIVNTGNVDISQRDGAKGGVVAKVTNLGNITALNLAGYFIATTNCGNIIWSKNPTNNTGTVDTKTSCGTVTKK